MRPQQGTYPVYYENYIPLVKENELYEALENNWKDLKQCISAIPAEKENFAYGPGKWTIKELVNHLIDTERIFAYRALRFARKDPQQVLAFEEDDYVRNAPLGHRTLKDILAEYETVRNATLSLFRGCTPESLLYKGKTAAGETTVLAIGFTIAGHATHHIKILTERYLKK